MSHEAQTSFYFLSLMCVKRARVRMFCSERSDFIILSRAKRALSLLTARGLSQLPKINLSLNICLVAANDVMAHFAFPGNIDFAADDQGAFHVIFDTRLLCLLIVCETVFTIGESRTISHPNDTELQAQQVPTNPRRERFSIETPRENAD